MSQRTLNYNPSFQLLSCKTIRWGKTRTWAPIPEGGKRKIEKGKPKLNSSKTNNRYLGFMHDPNMWDTLGVSSQKVGYPYPCGFTPCDKRGHSYRLAKHTVCSCWTLNVLVNSFFLCSLWKLCFQTKIATLPSERWLLRFRVFPHCLSSWPSLQTSWKHQWPLRFCMTESKWLCMTLTPQKRNLSLPSTVDFSLSELAWCMCSFSK